MPTSIEKNIGEKLSELMDEHSVSPERLAQATNIPLRFIMSLKNNEFDKLPASPYVRGYLGKISLVLKTNEEELMSIYKESAKIKASGTRDRLPSNQFAKVPLKKGSIIASAVFALILIMVFARFNDIFGLPEIEVVVPDMSQTEVIIISGEVKPGDRVTLNGEPIYTDENGKFEENLPLSSGLNTLEFKVKRFLGRESTLTKQVYYEAPKLNTPPSL